MSQDRISRVVTIALIVLTAIDLLDRLRER